ncbi:MAG: hypothetical protein EOO13_17385 [Chitinophagaceae bacterium]|nr:MAG: hypothetical protein EOO13_17385 [Chitinophagaceae bacterium]
MKNVLLFVCLFTVLASCKKDKFETVPQIEFTDMKNSVQTRNLLSNERDQAAILVMKVTDAEGDFGSNTPEDSSWIVIKHLLSNRVDSVRFPDLSRAPKTNFDAEVSVNLFDFTECFDPGPLRPRVDTIFYDVYIRDQKNHKSNTIRTTKPVLRTCE